MAAYLIEQGGVEDLAFLQLREKFQHRFPVVRQLAGAQLQFQRFSVLFRQLPQQVQRIVVTPFVEVHFGLGYQARNVIVRRMIGNLLQVLIA